MYGGCYGFGLACPFKISEATEPVPQMDTGFFMLTIIQTLAVNTNTLVYNVANVWMIFLCIRVVATPVKFNNFKSILSVSSFLLLNIFLAVIGTFS
jgi:hypothetical protein